MTTLAHHRAAERVTFAAIAEAGGHVTPDEDGYTLYLDGDCVGVAPDLAELAQLFAEAEAQRIADAVLAQITEERETPAPYRTPGPFASLRDLRYTQCPCGCGAADVCDAQRARVQANNDALPF